MLTLGLDYWPGSATIRSMRATLLLAIVPLAACIKSGEHRSQLAVCGNGGGSAPPLSARTVDVIDAALRARLTEAGFTACTWAKPRPLQLGATPVAWFCGDLGGTKVEASINRPGMDGCAIELDLRADVSGTESAITKREQPVMAFRNATRDWVEGQLDGWLAADGATGASIATSGAVLGSDPGSP